MKQDYVSRAMDGFVQALSTIGELKKEGRWDEVIKLIGVSLNRLLSVPPQEFRELTEAGMFARLVRSGPAFLVPYKTIVLIALLKETGDYAALRAPPRGGRGWYLRALHLLLDFVAHNERGDYSELLPDVEFLLTVLGDSPLPIRTRLLLMCHFEREGLFGRVKNEFEAALQKEPHNVRLLNFGIATFERLSACDEVTLAAAGLPRAEALATLDLLILSRVQVETNYPGPCTNASDPNWIRSQPGQSRF